MKYVDCKPLRELMSEETLKQMDKERKAEIFSKTVYSIVCILLAIIFGFLVGLIDFCDKKKF